ncbi:MAG TPA: TIGR03885 family FMN-dependent LLM class oxidoreductase, partial [Thermomicrobiales bacterium]|nr:TIGR03885 family FMN-dependent LLM class oxidoreductase [Thermomicrobiales bacterium]
HASHEQFPPSELLEYVQLAERSGFAAAMCSDHFMPWSDVQGESGFAWSWLGAAMARTTLPFGVVNAPGYRYHPAVIAQAAATLSEMFPGRFWIAVGSGEAMNEHITGERWPIKAERNARLRECVEIMRALWRGELVTHDGRVTVEEAKLYTLPGAPPLVVGAALSVETAGWMGDWADGLITINQPEGKEREVIEAFRSGGGTGKPVYLQVHVSWDTSEERARTSAFDQWRVTAQDSKVLADLRLPHQFEAAAKFVRPADMDAGVRISADPQQHIDWLARDLELDLAGVMLHNVGRNQREFIETFGREVLQRLT